MKFAKGRIFEVWLRLIASAGSLRCRLIADVATDGRWETNRGAAGRVVRGEGGSTRTAGSRLRR